MNQAVSGISPLDFQSRSASLKPLAYYAEKLFSEILGASVDGRGYRQPAQIESDSPRS